MDLADNAQIEIEREHERSIAALKKPLVESTAECIECGAEIPPERQQAVNTNLCIGCAELNELRSRHFRG